MLFASAVPPHILVKSLPQGFIAKMIPPMGVDLTGNRPVRIRSSNHMTRLFQRLPFQFSPPDKPLLLPQQVVPLQKVPQGIAVTHCLRNALAVVPGAGTAQPLDADCHPILPAQALGCIHHSQGMAVLRPPDVNHIRLEIQQLSIKQFFQLLPVALRRTLGKEDIVGFFIHPPRFRPTGAEQAHRNILPGAKVVQHMVKPQSPAAGSSAPADGTGGHIAKPSQLHFFFSPSSISSTFFA